MNKVIGLLLLLSFTNLGLFAQQEWSLQQCIDYAFQHNIQIRQSELNVQLSETGKTQSIASAFPNLNASASHGYNWGQTIDPFTNSFATERIRSNSFGISTGVTIFNGFQTLNTIRQSEIELEISKTNVDWIKNDVALNVSNAFLNVLFNREFLNIANSNLSATQQQADRIRQLVEAGVSPQGALYDIEAQLAADEAAVISAENNITLAKLNLTQLLQLSGTEAENFEIKAPELDDPETNGLATNSAAVVNTALLNFPQVKSAELSVLSAEKGLHIAKGTRSPSLAARFSYGTGYSGANQLVTGADTLGAFPIGQVAGTGETVLSLGSQVIPTDFETKAFTDQMQDNMNQSLFFTLTIPIFNGLNSTSSIQRAKINYESSKLNLESSRNELTQNVERAYADAQAALRSFQAAQKSVAASEEALKYATIRYEQGVINAVDYTTARVRLDNARADLLRNKYDYLFRLKVVEFYLGQPLTFR